MCILHCVRLEALGTATAEFQGSEEITACRDAACQCCHDNRGWTWSGRRAHLTVLLHEVKGRVDGEVLEGGGQDRLGAVLGGAVDLNQVEVVHEERRCLLFLLRSRQEVDMKRLEVVVHQRNDVLRGHVLVRVILRPDERREVIRFEPEYDRSLHAIVRLHQQWQVDATAVVRRHRCAVHRSNDGLGEHNDWSTQYVGQDEDVDFFEALKGQ